MIAEYLGLTDQKKRALLRNNINFFSLMHQKTLHVSGMHCVSCETLIEQELNKISDISSVKADHKKGTVVLHFQNTFPENKIEKILQKGGYKIEKRSHNASPHCTSHKKNTPKDWGQIALVFLGMLGVVFLFSHIGLEKFFPDTSGDVNFLIAFLIGIVASLSTCLALTGGIVLSFSSMYTVPEGSKNDFFYRALPQLYFHIGRVGGFALLGGILGSIGSNFQYSPFTTGIITTLVAVLMIYIGLHVLNIVPSITRFGIHLPKKITHFISDFQKKEHPFIPGIIGVLTFFLPCGFTQSMQLAAMASGSFFTGAMIMTFFALGTLPVLFSVGVGASFSQGKGHAFFKKVIGVIIIFFGIFSFNNGLIASGSTVTLNFWNGSKSEESMIEEVAAEKVQVVKMNVDYTFEPNVFTVQKGVPVRWEINGVNITGCSDEVIIPSMGISSGKLKKGLNIVEFTPTEVGTLPFSCWMGMIPGKFIVVEREEDGDLQGNGSSAKQYGANALRSFELQDGGCGGNGSCGGTCGNQGCGCGQ